MGWELKCIQTYDSNAAFVGEGENPLIPVFFITQKAAVEIELTPGGKFIGASLIAKGEEKTIIPATEASACRSSGVAAHPLCDQLCYVSTLESEKKFKAYTDLLEMWAKSEYTHPTVRAVYAYIMGGTILSDLQGMKRLDKKDVVRFSVRKDDANVSCCWQDKTLFDSYRKFYLGCLANTKGLCYVTGEEDAWLQGTHPCGTLQWAYKSKLVSANDNAGFTFRGRFGDDAEAFSFGAEASQKAHNALRWVIERQGNRFGSRALVAWNSVARIPGVFGSPDDDDDDDDDDDPVPTTETAYRQRVLSWINGYRDGIDSSCDKNVVLMGLEPATTGRLSVTYYSELAGSDYLDRIAAWHEGCCWEFWDAKTRQWRVRSPRLKEIVDFAFGTPREGYAEADDRVLPEQMQVLFRCVTEGAPVPYSTVALLVQNCANRPAYEAARCYGTLLSVTCAVLRKHYKTYYGKEIIMELDEKERDRSYLYGRLLAVAEAVEQRTYRDGDGREPNARRLQPAYVQRPAAVWQTLEQQLLPYFAQLSVGLKRYYQNLIDEIFSLFRDSDLKDRNNPLGEMYLFGYHLQRKALRSHRSEKSENQEEK